MKVTPDPTLTVLKYTQEDKINRVEVQGEKVIDFRMSQNWYITRVIVTKDRSMMVLTVEKGETDDTN